jgi:hypothetical protein
MEVIKKVNHYNVDEIIDTFGIHKTRGNEPLKNWLTAQYTLSEDDGKLLERIYQRVQAFADGWNEEELKMNFVSFVLFLADIDEVGKIRTFFERSLIGTIGNVQISVKTDCMIASPKGLGTPREPYFFLQEFKKQKGDKNDPEGQMLAAMVLAQHLNNDHKPIHGCWLVGNIWYFTMLEGQSYYQSNSFDANDKKDLTQIVFILRKLKELILER